VACPFEEEVVVIMAEQPAFARTLIARTIEALLTRSTDAAVTPPSLQMSVTFEVDAMSPPESQLVPGFTTSTVSVSLLMGLPSLSFNVEVNVTAPLASGFTLFASVLPAGKAILMLAMNGIWKVSTIAAKSLFTVWLRSPSSYTTSASFADELDAGLNDGKVTEPSTPVAYFGGATKQYAQFICPK
jgi:hypothetical protein